MSERNNNQNEQQSPIQGVGNNSYMHKCYFGSIAKVTGYDVIEFLGGFIKDLRGEIDVKYSQDPNTGEVQGMLAIPYKLNSRNNNNNRNNNQGLIPIPGLNSSKTGGINEQVMKSIERIKLQGYQPTVLYKDDAILFRIDFAAVVAEMMNASKGYETTIDDLKLRSDNDIVAIVSVYKSRNKGNANRMSRVLQGQRFTRNQNQQQPQRYNGGRR